MRGAKNFQLAILKITTLYHTNEMSACILNEAMHPAVELLSGFALLWTGQNKITSNWLKSVLFSLLLLSLSTRTLS